jgi:cyanophycin synthetase
LRLIESRHFPGINVHCFKPALEAVIDLGELAGRETSEFPDFAPALVKILPGLKEHICGLGRQGGFWLRLQKGTYFGHVVEHTAIELLNLAGYQSSYGKTRVVEGGVYRIVIQCHWPKTALLALEMAINLVTDLLQGLDPDTLDIEKLERQLAREMPGPSTQAIIDAASSRGIPVTLLGHGSLLRLGTGVYRQYIEATVTGKTSCIGVDIACDKTLTKKILANALIPTPRGKIARDEEDAVAIVKEMGVTAVVKPCDGNQGKGVSLNLASEAQVRSAYKVAENYGSKVLVEEQIFGRHYRILVVNNKVVAVSERFPALVTGDGINSIKELIEIENGNPLRGEEHEKPLTKIKVDQIVFNVLARQNLTMNYIPAPGEVINLRDNANLSTGGTAADVTDLVHRENIWLACRIARLLCLDIAGIDIVTEDIAQPLLAGKGAVIEVNAAPGIRMHLFPAQGARRPVGDAIVDYLFPWQRPHSIPIISVTGTNGKTTVSRLVAHVLRRLGKTVGLTSTDGIYIDGSCINAGDNTGPISADAVLSDPAVEVAVLETARGGLVRRGLGYTEAAVAVITNIANDHLGSDGIDSLEELCHVKALVAETVSEDGFAVLNADDDRVAALAERCPGRIIYFSCQQENKILARHLAAGGRGVMLIEDKIYLAQGKKAEVLSDTASLPITFGGAARYNVANCLAAAGALWALDVDKEEIAAGMREFDGNSENPGRANHYDFGSFKLLLDYGHNYAGFKAVLELVDALQPARKVGVIGMPGDRTDSDIIQSGRLCGSRFDMLYVKEDRDLRGRRPGQVAALLVRGIESSGAKPPVKVIHDELEALQAAIKSHQPGDLIAVFYENIEPVQEYIKILAGQEAEAGIYFPR